jgi:hypothetical protein
MKDTLRWLMGCEMRDEKEIRRRKKRVDKNIFLLR